MTKAHKTESHEGFLLSRKLKVDDLDSSDWQHLLDALNGHPCVDFARCRAKNRLEVIYDGSHWSTDELLTLISDHHGRIENTWWTRRKLAWYRFTDENVRANANHKPFCCSKIPPMKK